MDRYGKPDESTANMLIGNNNGPWKKTIVYKQEVIHNFPMKHFDVVEQVIDYKVPFDKYDEIASYDGSIICKRTEGEISAKCDNEAANFLALNMANEIATEKRNVDDARKFYSETMKSMMSGKSSTYLEKLLFNVQKGNTADPDKALDITSMKK